MMARGKRRRSSATRVASAGASGSGPGTTVTDVVTVAIVVPACTRSGADEAELPQPSRGLDGDRVLVREAGVAEPTGPLALRPRAVDRVVQPGEREVAERVGPDELADLLRRVVRGEQL